MNVMNLGHQPTKAVFNIRLQHRCRLHHVAYPKFCIKIHKRKRCYYDSRLYLSVPTFILSFSVQTSAIRNDTDTIISASIGLVVGCTSYFEIVQRFYEIFECEKAKDPVQVRDQRRIFVSMKNQFED